MSAVDTQIKLEQFNEFFSIEHTFSVNITTIDSEKVPTYAQFVQQIPLPFKIASDIVSLDQASFKPLQAIGGVANQLVEYLHHQTQKIDLLVGYIISQQDDEKHRFQGTKFGGGGLVFSSEQTFVLGQMLTLKIFLLNNTCAVYCTGEVIEVTEQQYKVVFQLIREDDREVLVRNSLHEQSKQLQALAKQRSDKNNEIKGS